MKHYFQQSRRAGYTYSKGPHSPLGSLYYIFALAAALSAFPVLESPYDLLKWAWGFAVGVVALIGLLYVNRIRSVVYIEDSVLYRKGLFFGFRTQLTEEYIKEIVYKKTLLGDSILILSNDCQGKPSTWSKSVVVVLDTPDNRDTLHYLKDRTREEFLI